ncbi:MAG: N-acetylmuramoyl-L-alanine amidase [Candidatus Margulisiibacteriota bacterium]
MLARHFFIFIITIFMALPSPARILDYQESSAGLLINNKKVNLDTPLVIMNGYTLLPLHDLAKAIEGELVRNRITDEYFFSIDNAHRFVFTPNDRFVEYNNGTLKMPVTSPELFGRIYVPLVFLMEKLDYSFLGRKPDYRFQKTIKTQNDTDHPTVNTKTYLPTDLNLDETTDIPKEKEAEETSKIESRAKIEFLKVSEPAGQPAYLSTGKKNIYINNTNWPGESRIYLASYAHRDNKDPQVEIMVTHKTTPEIGILPNPRRIVLDFPQTIMDTPTNDLTPENQIVKSIRLGQNTPNKARIVIETDSEYTSKTLSDRVIVSFPEATAAPGQKTTTKEISPVKGKKIAIMAGHGGLDPGAVGQRKTLEKDMCLDTSKRLQKLLLDAGAEVVMVRDKDIFMSLRQRVTDANNSNADATVSVHFNSSKWKHLLGIETYYYKSEDYSLARFIHKYLIAGLKRPDRQIRRARFYELNHTKMPCVLVESAYISNYWEEMLIRNDSFREKIAYGIFRGLEEYFRK